MGIEEDVRKINKKLDRMVSNGSVDTERAVELLGRLKEIPVTLDILQATGIGLTVNSLRKKSCSDDKVCPLAKSIVKAWKKLLANQSGANSDDKDTQGPKEKRRKLMTDGGGDSEEGGSRSGSVSPDGQAGGDASTTNGVAASNASSTTSTSSPQPLLSSTSIFGGLPESLQTSDPIRHKCRELLVGALKTDPQPQDAVDHAYLAASIEDCIYCEFGGTEVKYKNRVRSRYSNLKDAKNPGLRYNVLVGDITPDRIAKMTAEEMASDEMKQIRQQLSKEAMNDHQMAKNEGTKTDLIKCIRCKKSNCSYNQMQTRSADEPMTTFVFCNECGMRWKFC